MRFNNKKVKEREKAIKEQKKILETYKNFNDENTSTVGKILMK
jgi:hypothetical protein